MEGEREGEGESCPLGVRLSWCSRRRRLGPVSLRGIPMGMRTAAFFALVTWIIALIYFSSSLYSVQRRDDDSLGGKLQEAIRSIDELKVQNQRLRQLASEDRERNVESVRLLNELLLQKKRETKLGEWKNKYDVDEGAVAVKNSIVLTKEREEMRREIDNRILEVFFYTKSHIANAEVDRKVVAEHVEEELVSLLGLSSRFSQIEGAGEERRKGLSNLTQHIQKAINKLQNPSDCKNQRVLVCNLDKQCGFGCQLHHVAFCFLVAFGEGRMLVMEKDGQDWRYSRQGWVSAFLPVSSCSHKEAIGGDRPIAWTSSSSSRVVSLPIVDSLRSLPPFIPLSFPSSISDQLLTYHSNPPAFFIGQFLRYLMRENSELEKHLTESAEKIPFGQGPIVGVQVRRTDKVGTEAAFHSIDEYMQWTELYFRVEEAKERKELKRRVFIATDDPSVIKEAREKYPKYEVYGDEKNAKSAQLESRYTDSSLLGVVTDIELLSNCSYLVCTFSSQVCRMGYELMQVRSKWTGEEFHSLDDIYYFGGQQAHEQIVVEDYKSRRTEEIDLKVGEVVGIAGNHWDGFSKGTKRTNGKVGLYPSYKVHEKWRIVEFPHLPPLE